MIQSKNKFLPTLYIRKCKITYLECYYPDGQLPRQLLSSSEAWPYTRTRHTHVRAHGRQTRSSGRSPVRCLGGEAGCVARPCGGEQMYATQTPERWSVCVRECTRMCESVISALGEKGKETRLSEAVAHSTSCQRKYYHEDFGFHLLVLEVVSENLKAFNPYNFRWHTGVTCK